MFTLHLRQIVFASLSGANVLQGEIHEIARVSVLWFGATASVLVEGTGSTDFGRKAGIPATGSGVCHTGCLSMRTGDTHWVPIIILFDLKIRQIEAVWVGLFAANSSLEQLNAMVS